MTPNARQDSRDTTEIKERHRNDSVEACSVASHKTSLDASNEFKIVLVGCVAIMEFFFLFAHNFVFLLDQLLGSADFILLYRLSKCHAQYLATLGRATFRVEGVGNAGVGFGCSRSFFDVFLSRGVRS